MVDLFAGFPVTEYVHSLQWYRQLLGSEPSFYPNEREAVWQIDAHLFVYFEVLPERAGGSLSMIMAEDGPSTRRWPKSRPAALSHSGSSSIEEGMRKVVYQDPDGNELSFGGTSAVKS